MFLRSKSKWLKEGDSNSSSFHAYFKSKSKKNVIIALNVRDVLLEWASEIR